MIILVGAHRDASRWCKERDLSALGPGIMIIDDDAAVARLGEVKVGDDDRIVFVTPAWASDLNANEVRRALAVQGAGDGHYADPDERLLARLR